MEYVKKYGWVVVHSFLSLGLLAMLVWAFARGLDFTDEADSLLATMQPFDMSLRFSEYMFYTNWLYECAGGSLFWFRLYGLILLLIPSAYLGKELVGWLQDQWPLDAQTGYCVLMTVLAASTVYYCKWYTAPNYYWLAQVGLTVVGASLLHIARLRREGRFSALLFVVLGAGLAITGFGRVTAAALAIVLVCVVVMIMFRRDPGSGLKALVLTGLTGLILLLAHMVFVAGGVMSVVDVYWSMLSPERASDRGSLATQMGYVVQAFIFIVKKSLQGGLVIVGVPLLAHWLWRGGKVRHYPVWMIGIVIAYYWRYVFRNYGDPSEVAATIFSLSMLSSWLFVCFMPLDRDIKKRAIGWGGVLFLLAASMGFGSAMPLLWGMSRSLVFLAAGVLICVWIATAHNAQGRVAQGLCFVVMLTAVGLNVSAVFFHTYRQPPLWQHTENVVLHGKNSVKLWPEAADFVQTLQAEAVKQGWKPGTPLLDFGADNAGIAYVLEASTPGNGRIYGGYDNTDMFARIVTRCLSPEQKQKAWIVTSTDTKSRVSPDVVQELFPNFPQGYIKVWEHTNIGLEQLEETQMLWKPKV